MNEIWCCFEGNEPEFFDCEETAILAYKKWCEISDEQFQWNTFYQCYAPLSQMVDIWTKETLNNYTPS